MTQKDILQCFSSWHHSSLDTLVGIFTLTGVGLGLYAREKDIPIHPQPPLSV